MKREADPGVPSPPDELAPELRSFRHDLRTPLNHILGYAELVLEEATEEGLDSMVADLEKVRAATHQLMGTLDQVLADPDALAAMQRAVSAALPDAPEHGTLAPTAGGAPTPSTGRDAPTTSLGGRLLVVDDNAGNRDLLARHLRAARYEVDLAEDGRRCLECFEAQSYDLVLLDIQMPGLSGIEVLEILRKDHDLTQLPVIMVTAMHESTMIVHALGAGANDYVTKPLDVPVVLARVHTQRLLKDAHDKIEALLGEVSDRNRELSSAYEIIKVQNDRMEEELRIGREMQMSMMPPESPDLGGETGEFSIHACLTPARELGGDFWDAFPLDNRRLLFCVGDVSDKGVASALFMASAKALIRSRATEDSSIANIINSVNNELTRNNSSCMFVTLFAGIVDTSTGDLTYTNAGHGPPYVRRREGRIEQLKSIHGPVAGALSDLGYGSSEARLEPGDLLVVSTDGVSEALNPQGEFYTDRRLIDVLAGLTAGTSAATCIDRTFESVRAFEAGADQADDITVLVVERADPLPSETTVEFRIPNHLDALPIVEERLEEFAGVHGIQTELTTRLKVIFDELLSNVVSYGYDDDARHNIEIRLMLQAARLVVTVADDGVAFDPLTTPPPDTEASLDHRQIGGLGIHLVRNLVDEAHYERRHDQNVLTLALALPGAPPTDPAST